MHSTQKRFSEYQYVWKMFGLLMALLLLANSAYALDVAKLKEMYKADDFQGISALCQEKKAEIDKDEYVDRFLYFCGQANFNLFEKGGPDTLATQAIDDLERSLYSYYLPSTAFALGKARVASIKTQMGSKDSMSVLKQGINEMWDAITNKHAQEDYQTDVLSDQILGWTISYYQALIDGLIQGDENTKGWLTARIRMISDRYAQTIPANISDQVRRGNLETVSSWMRDLYESTYFDRNAAIGMYKFLGERNKEEYDQSERTEPKFMLALDHYKKGLSLTASNKAKAVMKEKISDLTQWIISENKEKKIFYYRLGFQHAKDALKLLTTRGNIILAEGMAYHFEPPTDELIELLRKDYGRNLSGLLYFLWERKDYQAVVELRSAFSENFDWKTKLNDLLRISDSAAKIARAVYSLPRTERNIAAFDNSKWICLKSSYEAFHYALNKSEKQELSQEELCSTLDAYSAFLIGFGELAESGQIVRLYGPLCKDKLSTYGSPTQTPTQAPSATTGTEEKSQ